MKFAINTLVRLKSEIDKDRDKVYTYIIVDSKEHDIHRVKYGRDYAIKKVENKHGYIKGATLEFVFEQDIFADPVKTAHH